MPVRGVNRRYLAIKIYSENEVKEKDLFNAIEEKINFLYGVVGASRINYRPIGFEDGIAIIRCNHLWVSQMRSVIAHIKEINFFPVMLQVIRISGTIKTLKKKIKNDQIKSEHFDG
jgi:RNase P/RNase MRP subunit POP5